MIHRFVDLPEVIVVEATPVFLYKLEHTVGGSLTRWWLGGNLASPVKQTGTEWSTSSGSTRGDTTEARASSDLTRVLYNFVDSSLTPDLDKIKITPTEGNAGSIVDIAQSTSTTTTLGFACWNGDETKVVYAKEVPSGGISYAQIRIVDDDGTNDTLLYNRGGISSGEFIYVNIGGLLVNHSGTKIAWVDVCQSVGGLTNAGIYVMDIDGTNVTRLIDWSSGNFRTSDHMIGFSHDDTYLGFTQTYDDGTGTKVHFKKVTMAGTITDLFASTAYFRQEYDYQWLPDDSGILAIHANVYGTAPRSVIEVIPAAGGSPVALSPERRIDTSGAITQPKNYPVVCDQDDRIYWYDLASTSIVSVAADGSDFRTDHTLDGTGADVSNDQTFRTIFQGI